MIRNRKIMKKINKNKKANKVKARDNHSVFETNSTPECAKIAWLIVPEYNKEANQQMEEY